ncbi:MAG: alanine racemase [Actinobacteria bacterium HGW-Actinobacteria-1]|jgi:alanine racemase|nr:MAG: alanine racemase [Actinobacteria bacterium HGW-Actinobacteria-1]
MTYRRSAWVEIDAAAITRNVRALKALTRPGTRFMAVVKADGYGHGSLVAAQAALTGGADRLGVATLEEAAALREGGISAPLHILSEPPVSGVGLVIELGVIPALYSREFAVALSRAAALADVTVRYHLKVDSGMNRIGVRAEEAHDMVAWLKGLPGIEMEGVFTHFATADAPGDWEFDGQVDRFRRAIDRMRSEKVLPSIVHAANSAATILHPETHYDMVRCGIAIYGLHPAASTYGKIELAPAMSVKARVSLVKRIGFGDGVSYGFTYHAGGPTTIATVPMGYADGVHRVLSNNMEVLIRGVRCRQVGRVCMDQMMIEVPDRLGVTVSDEVVLVGEQGTERIVMDELAERAGTINYELACGFALRMGRFQV